MPTTRSRSRTPFGPVPNCTSSWSPTWASRSDAVCAPSATSANIVGEFFAKHSAPHQLKDGVLYVSVLQPTVHFELDRGWKRDILDKLKKKFGARTVREIKFRLG